MTTNQQLVQDIIEYYSADGPGILPIELLAEASDSTQMTEAIAVPDSE